MKYTVKDCINGPVKFQFYRSGVLYYKCANGFVFEVPVTDTNDAVMSPIIPQFYVKQLGEEADKRLAFMMKRDDDMGELFRVGDYVYCTTSSYSIASWTPSFRTSDIYVYRVTKIADSLRGQQLLCLDGPWDEDLNKRNGYQPPSSTTTYRAENFKDALPYLSEKGRRKISNINTSLKWVDVRAVVFDNGNMISKHASREDAKAAVLELLKRNPTKQYDVFEYQATGKFPELPVVWEERTVD